MDRKDINWHGKPYYSLDAWCKNTYGHKLYKIALDAGCTCPNRDGTLGWGGCIFCSAGGSGDFAASGASVREQLDAGKKLLDRKWQLSGGFGAAADAAFRPNTFAAAPDAASRSGDFAAAADAASRSGSAQAAAARFGNAPALIAYFQSYTNTYGDPDRLCRLFSEALQEPDVAGISIATRPDCLENDILRRLAALRNAHPDKFIWIELGLQTIHDRTADFIRRGYKTDVFEKSMRTLRTFGIPAVVHTILGLPGESRDDVLATMRALNALRPFGIKLQLLHILKGTVLAELYESGSVSALSKEAYVELVTDCIASLSPDICIHRITGDGPGHLLLAPGWSRNKRDVLNSIHARMKQKGIRQGIAAVLPDAWPQQGETHHESRTTDPL